MAKKAETTKKPFDKTNTCQVNVIEGKTEKTKGKKYSLFVANIEGVEMTAILNSKAGKLNGALRRDKDQKESDATLTMEKVISKSLEAPQFRGIIETKKGNRFEFALWEQFGKGEKGAYHFWSGRIKPEGEGYAEDDGSNPFVNEYRGGEKLPVSNDKDDDLPF